MSGTHKLLSPSSAKRRILCAGSLAMSSPGPGIPPPESKSSQDAASGTASHSMGEQCLRNCWDPDCFEGQVIEADGFKFRVDNERIERVRQYVEAVRSTPGDMKIEVALDTSNVVGVPGQGGTGDAVVLDYAHDTIHAGDFKDGQGKVEVWTGPRDGGWPICDGDWFHYLNPQLGEYGAAALDLYEIVHNWRHVRMVIYQPRIGWFDEITLTVEQLRAWVEWLRPREQKAHRIWLTGVGVTDNLSPSDDACRWCPAAGSCSARTDEVLKHFPISPVTVPVDTTPIGQRMVTTLSNAELAFALDRVAFIEQWCKAVYAEGLARELAGNDVPGWKATQGKQGARKWDDEDAVMVDLTMGISIASESGSPRHIPGVDKAALAELCMTQPELLTLPAMEKTKFKTKYKALWQEVVARHMTQAPGGYTLVRDFDARPALAPNAVTFPIAAPASEFGAGQSVTEGLV